MSHMSLSLAPASSTFSSAPFNPLPSPCPKALENKTHHSGTVIPPPSDLLHLETLWNTNLDKAPNPNCSKKSCGVLPCAMIAPLKISSSLPFRSAGVSPSALLTKFDTSLGGRKTSHSTTLNDCACP